MLFGRARTTGGELGGACFNNCNLLAAATDVDTSIEKSGGIIYNDRFNPIVRGQPEQELSLSEFYTKTPQVALRGIVRHRYVTPNPAKILRFIVDRFAGADH